MLNSKTTYSTTVAMSSTTNENEPHIPYEDNSYK
jgi:hypothetical protein